MPGLYGYVKQHPSQADLGKMSNAMLYMGHFIKDNDFSDHVVEASRVHLGKVGMPSSPFVADNLILWIEGECYNMRGMRNKFSFSQDTFAQGLANAYRHDQLDAYLNQVDGYFCAVIYDRVKNKVLLISDRYGMRMLYFYFKAGCLAWGSEVKALLALDFVEKKINRDSICCFLDLGHLLGAHTWLEDVKLIDPASIVEFDAGSGKLSQHHYWQWSEIRQQEIGFEEAAERIGHLLVDAVKVRFNREEKVGISLSGGLDSRALFAAVNKIDPDYSGYAYTFGLHGCLDVEIAKQVISKSNWRHQVFELTVDNWFEPRVERVWCTDGMFNLKHMHGSEFSHVANQNMSVNLSGYAGDAVLGGGFFRSLPVNKRIDAEIAQKIWRNHSHLAEINSGFYETPHVEPAVYLNRVRRFTNMGTANELIMLDQRKPFFDNKLMEFIFSIDDRYRDMNKLYAAVLLNTMPEFFKTIPWQATGKTVDKTVTVLDKIFKKISKASVKFGLAQGKKDYVNYPDWIRNPLIEEKLTDLLTPRGSVYSDYIGEDLNAKFLQPHLKSRAIDASEQILAAATMEIYFRKIFK
jgi:asparagine synthetase B (glutamine-hydrolysing)